MARLRFERVRDRARRVSDRGAFELDIEPSDEGSLDFLSSLAGGGELGQGGRLLRLPAAAPRSRVVGLPVRARRSFPRRTLESGKDSGSPRSGCSEPEEDRVSPRSSSACATTASLRPPIWRLRPAGPGAASSVAGGDPVPIPPHADRALGPRRDPDRGRPREPGRAAGADARLRRGRHQDRGRRHGAGLMARTSGRVDRPIAGGYARETARIGDRCHGADAHHRERDQPAGRRAAERDGHGQARSRHRPRPHLDWTLPDPTRFISGKHCEVRYRDGGYWLHDVSTNGTFPQRQRRPAEGAAPAAQRRPPHDRPIHHRGRARRRGADRAQPPRQPRAGGLSASCGTAPRTRLRRSIRKLLKPASAECAGPSRFPRLGGRRPGYARTASRAAAPAAARPSRPTTILAGRAAAPARPPAARAGARGARAAPSGLGHRASRAARGRAACRRPRALRRIRAAPTALAPACGATAGAAAARRQRRLRPRYADDFMRLLARGADVPGTDLRAAIRHSSPSSSASWCGSSPRTCATAQCAAAGQAPRARVEPDHDPGAQQQSAEILADRPRTRCASCSARRRASYLDAQQRAGGRASAISRSIRSSTYSAMQQALAMMVADLDPQAIESATEADRGLSRRGRIAQGAAVGRLCGALAGQDARTGATGWSMCSCTTSPNATTAAEHENTMNAGMSHRQLTRHGTSMSWYSKVVWSEGLFLRPHHLQQNDRYLEHLVESRVAARHALSVGLLAIWRSTATSRSRASSSLRRAAGVMPDGTPFDIPADSPLPEPIDVPETAAGQIAWLSMPVAAPNTREVDERDVRERQPLRLGRRDVHRLRPRRCASRRRSTSPIRGSASSCARPPSPAMSASAIARIARGARQDHHLRREIRAAGADLLGASGDRRLDRPRRSAGSTTSSRSLRAMPPTRPRAAACRASTISCCSCSTATSRCSSISAHRATSIRSVCTRSCCGSPANSRPSRRRSGARANIRSTITTISRTSSRPLMRDIQDFLSARLGRRAIRLEIIERAQNAFVSTIRDRTLFRNATLRAGSRGAPAADRNPESVPATCSRSGRTPR